jgi:hypothetical protein
MLEGVAEANPLARWAMEVAPNPLSGLVLLKVVALVLGIYCVLSAREKLLGRVNVFFAALVAYNLVALIIAAASVP